MKRITGLLCLLCGLSATAQTPAEAVGIHTEKPRGVLHIDGAADNQDIITAAQAANDVLIDASGQLGIGVAAPAARVDIQGALRIADTTQGADLVLTSDATGAGRWKERPTGVWWYAALYTSPALTVSNTTALIPRENYGDSLISSGYQSLVDKAAGTITVPFAGKYRVSFSVHYMSSRTGENPYWAVSVLQVNGSARWTPSIWGTRSQWGAAPTHTAILNLNPNDVLKLFLDPGQTFSANHGGGVVAFTVELIQQQ